MALFKKKKTDDSSNVADDREILCDKLGFAASEAYKLLRANIAFAIPGEEERCRIVGITSSNRSEGKSTTSVNLAYTLAQTGKRVLLIDCDMRIPTIGKKLSVHNSPGLSNFIAGQVDAGSALQESGFLKNWKILAAGDIPPNPSELLGSDRMKNRMDLFAKNFDYIIMDLPPINIVADALAVARIVDGIVMVARQDYSDKKSVADAVNLLQMANLNILGFVLTRASSRSGKYGRYNNYNKYSSYGYGYGDGYGYGYGGRKKITNEDTETLSRND